MAIRAEVYDVINGERAYQKAGKGNARRADGQSEMTLGEHLLCMERLLNSAREEWYKPFNARATLDDIRKITAVGVAAMELYGAPPRGES